MATWEDLANVYTGLSQWRDAEVCLSKSKAMNPYSASGWHSSGKITAFDLHIIIWHIFHILRPYVKPMNLGAFRSAFEQHFAFKSTLVDGKRSFGFNIRKAFFYIHKEFKVLFVKDH